MSGLGDQKELRKVSETRMYRRERWIEKEREREKYIALNRCVLKVGLGRD